MKIWSWYGAGNGFTALLPVRDEDIFSDVFTADGTPKTWTARPQVKPGIERNKKKQKPLGDLSSLMGASIIMNEKAYSALRTFLEPFGQFLPLDMLDETGLAGGDQPLYFYNVTNVIAGVDIERSVTEDGQIIKPAFAPGAVPASAQVFKDPRLLKMNIFLNDAAHAELTRRIESASLQGSTFIAQD